MSSREQRTAGREGSVVLQVREIQAKSILIKRKNIDSWFVSRYGMNLYRGCGHNCAYCDGRAESYYVEGEFGRDVRVKINAPELLRRELDPARKRKPLQGGYFLLGGGVGDSYQSLEQRYRLTRRALELMAEFDHPVHILTKSTLVLRDLDLIGEINRRRRAVVCFSISSVDEQISGIYEPGVPSPRQRLEAMKTLKANGIPCGLFLLPVIPFLTDGERMLEDAVQAAVDAGADYLLFGGMTLKHGRQSGYFLDTLRRHRPDLLPAYLKTYGGDRWGRASTEYSELLHSRFRRVLVRRGAFRIAPRMPAELYGDLLGDRDRLVVMLEQMDYLSRLRGGNCSYGYAARRVSKWEGSLSELPSKPIPGISAQAGEVIAEILSTGSSAQYRRLMGCSTGQPASTRSRSSGFLPVETGPSPPCPGDRPRR